MSELKSTPMMSQYFSIKEQYKDSILFFRMGDFYEMFFEDAEIASKVLDITLTSRNKNEDIPVPMCGIPYKAAEAYIARLISRDYKVAICDQVEDPKNAKGIVRREVVRVITPGMILEDTLLDARINNFVASISKNGEVFGLSCLDISTGTFRISETTVFEDVLDEILRIKPSEVVVSEKNKDDGDILCIKKSLGSVYFSFINDNSFSIRNSRDTLLNHFSTRSLEGFGCEDLQSGICAAGALLSYVKETQMKSLSHVTGLVPYRSSDFLIIDDSSFRNLDVFVNQRTGQKTGALIDIIDMTMTPMGGRLLRNWLRYPLVDLSQIDARLDAVDEAVRLRAEREISRNILKSVADLERLGSRITMNRCSAREFVALKRSLNALPELWMVLSTFESPLFDFQENLSDLSILADLIDQAIAEDPPASINEGGMIKEGYNSELDELISISRDGKSFLAKLEAEEKEKTGISSLKVKYNRVFGYFIEVSKAASENVPASYVRKQTLVNAERYITDELKVFETKVLNAYEERVALELAIFEDIRLEIVKHNPSILKVASFISNIDCLTAIAQVAEDNDYVRPIMNNDGIIRIEDGRHPVVEKTIDAGKYVPNSIYLDNNENQILIITGPNMAGKSTVLRQAALTVLMAQSGFFVPAARADISVTDRVFVRVGASDNLASGQSTFMVEMEETANIINNATPSSLVVMDEIGRGTSTFDGISIAWAIVEYLHDLSASGVKTLFATHYHELTELDAIKPRVKNFNIAVKEWNDEIIFLHRLVEGGASRSYGIQVARLAGIPHEIIARSKKILTNLESGSHDLRSVSQGTQARMQKQSRPRQLELFRKPENVVVEILKGIDILSLTPLEALNKLSELKEKIRDIR
ncbi:DNA mismatch repair protein MutS [Desulforegula conservatrix]|uniref:DNA mismatch repair protein MutS n=1 Tax=Desulforegula conservatrix TaxID=153026 RepID=UPI000426354C|nr:DNA mismatch repair protein MutS [Desulforegula conservatrix]